MRMLCFSFAKQEFLIIPKLRSLGRCSDRCMSFHSVMALRFSWVQTSMGVLPFLTPLRGFKGFSNCSPTHQLLIGAERRQIVRKNGIKKKEAAELRQVL
jgi:hypothetical protein